MKEQEKQDPQEVIIGNTPEQEHTPEETTVAPEDGTPSLQQIIRDQATEEDAPLNKTNLSLKRILFGDFLNADVVKRQIWLCLLITLFMLIYIAQRYSYQKYIVEIDKLSTQLKDVKFRALSSKSELTEKTRQSKILDLLKENNDTLLKIADKPPYYIHIPE